MPQCIWIRLSYRLREIPHFLSSRTTRWLSYPKMDYFQLLMIRVNLDSLTGIIITSVHDVI